MRNLGIGLAVFPFMWKIGAWRSGVSWSAQFGPFALIISRT